MNKKSQSPKTKSLLWAVVALVYSTPSFAEQPSLPEPKNGDCSGFKECQGNFNAEKRPLGEKGPMWSLMVQVTGKQIWYDSSTNLAWGYDLSKEYSYDDAVKFEGRNVIPTACNSELSIGKVQFRLPTLEEYKQAEADGIQKVIQETNGKWYWTLTLDPHNINYALIFNISANKYDSAVRNYSTYSIRCVAALPPTSPSK